MNPQQTVGLQLTTGLWSPFVDRNAAFPVARSSRLNPKYIQVERMQEEQTMTAMTPEPKSVERKIGDEVIRLESGRLAGQANGAVLASMGETTLLATATADNPRGEGDFFPLTIDVEERMYAAGKIPGGFFRREGRAGEKAILQCPAHRPATAPGFPLGLPARGPQRNHGPGGRRREPFGHSVDQCRISGIRRLRHSLSGSHRSSANVPHGR